MADISSLSVFAAIQDSGLRITFDTNIRWRDEELDLRCGDYGQRQRDMLHISCNGSGIGNRYGLCGAAG